MEMQHMTNPTPAHEALCPNCGTAMQYCETRGKVDLKKAAVGGLLTIGMGGIGAVAGFTDAMKKERQFVCPRCGHTLDAQTMHASCEILREKDLADLGDPVMLRFDVDFAQLAQAVTAATASENIPLAWKMGQIGGGFLSNAGASCLILYHPQHPADYYRFVIKKTNVGNFCKVSVFAQGNSTEGGRAAEKDLQVFDGSGLCGAALGMLRGGSSGKSFTAGSIGYGIGKSVATAVRKGIASMHYNAGAHEEEQMWYHLTLGILRSVLEG